MAPQVSQVTEPVSLGEGPHWDEDTHSLYFVSIFDYTIHRASSVYETAKLDEEPTFIIPIANKPNHFVVGLGRRVVALKWALGATTIVGALPALDDHNPGNRCNDAKCDPRGRLFVGTMGSEIASGQFDLKKGSLYRVDPDGRTHRVATDIDISNGMCWDVKEKAFYFIDSFEYTIRRYDYDIDTGEIVNPRCVFRFSEHVLEGIADGMTVDTDGCLWVANFDGHQVLKIDPRTSSLLEKIPIPASQVTSVAWGGTDLDVLFVTTASMDRGVKQLPPAGAVFAVNGLGVHGLKADKAKVDWIIDSERKKKKYCYLY